jgi:hypothetical protein
MHAGRHYGGGSLWQGRFFTSLLMGDREADRKGSMQDIAPRVSCPVTYLLEF